MKWTVFNQPYCRLSRVMPPKVKEGKQSNVRQQSPKKGATAQTPKGKNPVPPRRKKQTLTNGDSTSSTQGARQ